MCLYMFTYIYIYMNTYVYIYIYICMHIYICSVNQDTPRTPPHFSITLFKYNIYTFFKCIIYTYKNICKYIDT